MLLFQGHAHQRLSLRGVHFPPTCMQANTLNHSHKCNCLTKPGEGTYFRFNLFLCFLSPHWLGVINEASLTHNHSGDCGECGLCIFSYVFSQAVILYRIKLHNKKEKEWNTEKCVRKKWLTDIHLRQSTFLSTHYLFLFCFVFDVEQPLQIFAIISMESLPKGSL